MTGSSQITKLLECWRLGVDACVLKGDTFKKDLASAVTQVTGTVDRWKSAIDTVRKVLNA